MASNGERREFDKYLKFLVNKASRYLSVNLFGKITKCDRSPPARSGGSSVTPRSKVENKLIT